MRRTFRTAILAATVAAASLVAVGLTAIPASAGSSPPCVDGRRGSYPTRPATGLNGVVALPNRVPTTLIAFDHGYRKPGSVYWGPRVREAAAKGAVAFALDYRGIGPKPNYRGWNVAAGAADTIAATRYFLRHCGAIRRVILMGISMGGNASGLALAAQPKRANGRPLFDFWIDVEGATNVIETYQTARAAAPANEYAAGAQVDIEREMGGTFEEQPERYQRECVVCRVADVAASGVKGVVMVHAAEDGLVPYNQAREMSTALRGEGVPVDMFTVFTRGDGESGTTLSGDVLGVLDPGYQSPFAGHGGEESHTQLVITTGFARLWALLRGATVADGEHAVDGEAGTAP